MKKILLVILALALSAGGAFVVHQNLPMKRHARHLIKARLFAQEGNLSAARLEYEKAYNITDTYTPWVDIEVLRVVNRLHLQDRNLEGALADTRKFTETHPDNAEGWVMLAELALQSREPGLAFSAIESVLSQDPGNFPARLLLARIRTQQGRLDLAEEQLRTLYEVAPDSLDALIPLAENLLRQGLVAESRGFLRKAVASKPDNGMARLLLVDGYILERKPDSARAILDEWQGANPALALPIALRKTSMVAQQGRFDEARSYLEPHLDKKEENLQAWSELAVLHARQDQYDSAIAVYGAMEDIKPAAKAELMVLKAYLYLKTRNPARALEALKTASVADRSGALLPILAATYLSLGQEHKIKEIAGNQPDSAARRLEAFVAQLVPNPEFIGQWALINYYQSNNQAYMAFLAVKDLHARWSRSPMAIALWSGQLATARDFDGAARVFETLPPRDLGQSLSLLSLYQRAGRADKAKALAEKLLAGNPGQRGLNLFLADWHFSRGNRDAALAFYERELALDTASLVALNNLAWEHGVRRKDLEKARPYLERLRRHNSQDPRILDTVGWILAANGSPEARKYLETAVVLVPDQPSFNYHLGWHLARTGEKEKARKHLKTALDSGRPFDERAEAEKLLSQL